MANKAYKFRIYPTKKQEELINKTFGCVRFVYNRILAMRNEYKDATGNTISYIECAKDLKEMKKKFEFLKEVDSIALQQGLRHQESAFTNFYRDKKVGYPNFKRKHTRNSYSTVCVNGNIKLNENTITLPKIGRVKANLHREIPKGYSLKSVTISKEPSGEYYVSVLFEYNQPEISYETDLENSIGLDFSMKEGYVDSNGNKCEYPKFFRQWEAKLEKEQRILARRKEAAKKRGVKLEEAKNYQKQKRKVARLHHRIKNQRKDFLHKKSRELANAYDVVCIEDLNMKGMSQALNFGKSVSDIGWGRFTTYLAYKLEEAGKVLVKIGRYEPSSKRCHVCGYENQDLTLGTREWECPICHTYHDRDINAAINIKEIGLSMLTA